MSPSPNLDSLEVMGVQLEDMLKSFATVLRESSATYFLAYGTALGAHREGGLIPWDTDLDVFVPGADYSRVVAHLRQELPPPYAVVTHDVDPDYEHLFARVIRRDVDHKFIHIDLFPLVATYRFKGLRWAQITTMAILVRLFWAQRYSKQVAYLRQGSRGMAWRWIRRLGRLVPEELTMRAYRFLEEAPFARSKDLFLDPISKHAFPAAWFAGSVPGWIGRSSYPLPVGIHQYLSSYYGDYSSRPSAEQIQREVEVFERWHQPALSKVPLLLAEW